MLFMSTFIYFILKKIYNFFLINLLFIDKKLFYFYSFIKYVGYDCNKIYNSIGHNSVRDTYKITAGQGYAVMLTNTILAM